MRPGIENHTENIEIRSIVGRYLEHPRIYIFGKDKLSKIYIGSADLMTRNTERRVEVATPIFDSELKNKIKSYMECQWEDNVKARKMNSFGEYEVFQLKDGDTPINSQEIMMEQAIENSLKEIKDTKQILEVEKDLTIWERLLKTFFRK